MPLLVALFVLLILWLTIGICTSARTVARGADCIRSQLSAKGKSFDADPLQVTPDGECLPSCIQDVKSLFALYQCGALTREEFDDAKRHLLARLKACV